MLIALLPKFNTSIDHSQHSKQSIDKSRKKFNFTLESLFCHYVLIERKKWKRQKMPNLFINWFSIFVVENQSVHVHNFEVENFSFKSFPFTSDFFKSNFCALRVWVARSEWRTFSKLLTINLEFNWETALLQCRRKSIDLIQPPPLVNSIYSHTFIRRIGS